MITPNQFNIFVTTANVAIGAAYNEALSTPVAYSKFCETVPSGGSQNVYAWTGMLPKMREWVGPRVTVEPAAQTYTLVNQAFEGPNVAIDRFRLDDDQNNFYTYWRVLADMARQAARQPDYMFRDLLEGAGSQSSTQRQTGLDGQLGFSVAHPIDFYNPNAGQIASGTFPLGVYINDFTNGGQTVAVPKSGGGSTNVTVGGAFSPTAVATIAEYMMLIPAEDGEAIGVVPTEIMVSPFLKLEAETILKDQYFSPPAWGTITGQVGAAENALARFGLNLTVNPLLKNGYTYYLADTSKAFKPFVYQVREPVVFTPRTQETDPVVFDNHQYVWGQWGRMAVGWSYPWLYARGGV